MSQLKATPATWWELYQQLSAQAEETRGMMTIAFDEAPSVSYPSTTIRDVYAIALVFDVAIHDHAPESVVERWQRESELLAVESEDSHETYLGNRSYWEALGLAAKELDGAKVPLPDAATINTARLELATPREAAAQLRNAAMVVSVFAEPSWRAMATRQLELFRALRGIEGGTTFAPDVPRTCNGDVLALTHYWSEQLNRLGVGQSFTDHQLVFACWREVLARVLSRARYAPSHHRYDDNEEFWTALLLLTAQTDCDMCPTPWAFHVPMTHGRRNAEPVDTGATIDFPAAKSWDEAAQMQRDAFAKLRGEDRVTGRLVVRVPRTTNADVKQLASYWAKALSKNTRHDRDISARHVIERWGNALADVQRIGASAAPGATYEHNTDFWEALMTIAIQVAVTDEAPSRWTLIKASTASAVERLPDTLTNATSAVANAVQSVATRVLAKPLLYAGVGLGALATLVIVLRRPRAAEPRVVEARA